MIAFLDVLGMRAIAKGPSAARYLEAYQKTINNAHRQLHANSESFERHNWPPITITTISDSIVVSCPMRESTDIAALFVVSSVVGHIQSDFLKSSILTRGGLSMGDLYHTNNLVMGEALVDAYEIEVHNAIFPRVVLDDKVAVLLETALKHRPITLPFKYIFRHDKDGCIFIDYLRQAAMSNSYKGFDLLRATVHLSCDVSPMKVRQKYMWLRSYAKDAINDFYTVQEEIAERESQSILSQLSEALHNDFRKHLNDE
ncbi:hypothetical protein [Rhizobium ruizarguesonis]|uniref:hypothetical protein n=1 Tax=Rhizobium ruizarguesonis TaxID=2081791 RepID=UPI001031B07D|nr:hypothetical protein [Rhizobium ruizarguesonis]NEI32162.1 hypothetical protein [Rhizobium ruizarguesonis]TBB79469.1 hypothetical protein ELH38_37875 [Rhizobium ruizarguesonis]